MAAFGFFSIAETESFLTWSNAQSILNNAAPLAILAVGVTVVLVMGEFDLSIGPVVGLAGVTSVATMAFLGWATVPAIAVAIAVSLLAGFINGVSVAYIRIPSFIATLAVGAIAGGVEIAISQTTIFEGLNESYIDLAFIDFGGITLRTFIAIAVAIAFLVALRSTVFGRHVHAIGDNRAAARLSGVPVERVMVLGFMMTGMTAGIASILVAASAASYYPNMGTAFLLPAYAAAFLGLSLGGGLRFSVIGSFLGVLLLTTVTTGLNIMNQPSWLAELVQGIVLLAAVAGVSLRGRSALGR